MLVTSLLVGFAAVAEEAVTSPGSSGSGPVPRLDPNFRSTSHKVVLITDDGINPQQVQLKRNQLVAWISYSRSPSTIIFDREVARNMVCHSMVNFSIQQEELRSEPIDPGEFASFCELRPGTYPYRIVREPLPAAGRKGNPPPSLRGEIVVSEAD
ncbi:MAG: hypothetical protein VCB42_11445 [Myxococcota bacterium]